jgi:hypothetical protein
MIKLFKKRGAILPCLGALLIERIGIEIRLS